MRMNANSRQELMDAVKEGLYFGFDSCVYMDQALQNETNPVIFKTLLVNENSKQCHKIIDWVRKYHAYGDYKQVIQQLEILNLAVSAENDFLADWRNAKEREVKRNEKI